MIEKNSQPTSAKVLLLAPGLFADSSDPLSEKAEEFFRDRFEVKIARDIYSRAASEEVTLETIRGKLEKLARKLSERKPIVLVGHSFGALPVLALAARKPTRLFIERIVLWDPTLIPVPHDLRERVFVFREGEVFLRTDRGEVAIGRKFYDELTSEIADIGLWKGIRPETGVFFASDGAGDMYSDKYRKLLPRGHFFTVEEADHTFSDERKARELFAQTLEFAQN